MALPSLSPLFASSDADRFKFSDATAPASLYSLESSDRGTDIKLPRAYTPDSLVRGLREKYSGVLSFARMGKVGKAEAIFKRESSASYCIPVGNALFCCSSFYSLPRPPFFSPVFLRRFCGYVIGETVSTAKGGRSQRRARKLCVLYCVVKKKKSSVTDAHPRFRR